MRKPTVGLIAILVMALPIAVGGSDEPLPTVQLQVEVGEDVFTEPSGLTIRTSPGEPVVLRVEVFAERDPSSPVAVEDTRTLLEIREASGVGPAVRLPDMEEIRIGTYETSYTFAQAREYTIEILPDVEDRTLLNPDTTDEVTVMVDPSAEAEPNGPLWPMIMAVIALVLVMGVFVVGATRGRRRSPQDPVPHDTWWNSP